MNKKFKEKFKVERLSKINLQKKQELVQDTDKKEIDEINRKIEKINEELFIFEVKLEKLKPIIPEAKYNEIYQLYINLLGDRANLLIEKQHLMGKITDEDYYQTI